MTIRVTLAGPAPTCWSTPCRDCLTAYTCVAEMGDTSTPLPLVVQAVAVWPASTGPVDLCAPHHRVRAVELEQQLAADIAAEVVAS